MIFEEELYDVEVYRPPAGFHVLAITSEDEQFEAIYDGDDFLTRHSRESISLVRYWRFYP